MIVRLKQCAHIFIFCFLRFNVFLLSPAMRTRAKNTVNEKNVKERRCCCCHQHHHHRHQSVHNSLVWSCSSFDVCSVIASFYRDVCVHLCLFRSLSLTHSLTNFFPLHVFLSLSVLCLHTFRNVCFVISISFCFYCYFVFMSFCAPRNIFFSSDTLYVYRSSQSLSTGHMPRVKISMYTIEHSQYSPVEHGKM